MEMGKFCAPVRSGRPTALLGDRQLPEGITFDTRLAHSPSVDSTAVRLEQESPMESRELISTCRTAPCSSRRHDESRLFSIGIGSLSGDCSGPAHQ